MGSNGRASPLRDALRRQILDRPRALALRSEEEDLTLAFAELGERVAAWESSLHGAGAGPEGLVALAAGNAAAFPELFYALRGVGAPVLSLDAQMGAGGREACRRMGAGLLLHRDASLGGDPLPGAPDPRVRLTRLTDAAPPPAGTALVKLTSGSTLNPRGACFTEEALLEGIDHIARGMGIGPADRVLVAIPLSHSYGFDNGVLSLASSGTGLVLQQDVLPAALLRAMRAWEVTFFPAVPALVAALSRAPWPPGLALRRVISASAPLPREAAREFVRASGIPVQEFLGATECGGISFETRPADPAAEGCVGFPLPGVRVEFDPEGALRVHSAANRFALLPAAEAAPGVETGDRACWTPEGRLKLLGRAAQLANVAGFKVDLAAIDAFLRGLPGVDDAATLALEDPRRGDRLVACVETRVHTPRALLELCRGRLSPREVPGEIRVVERLPRTDRGKLDRAALMTEALGPGP